MPDAGPEAPEEGAEALFAIFALSIGTLVLLPTTIYACCASGEDANRPWNKVRGRADERKKRTRDNT